MGNSCQKDEYDTTDSPASTWPDWMSDIDDSISLASLSIPGTHNSMTYAGYGGPVSRCQTWPLSAQLEAGIRYLDIRCRHFTNNLHIHHGITYQHISFKETLDIVKKFLDKHPREVVLMRVKKEHTEGGNNRCMADTFESIVSQFDSKYFWTSGKIPNLGKARGKIVFLDNFEGRLFGIPYGSFDIADDYVVKTLMPARINQKWNSVERHLQKARESRGKKVFLTYSSGASAMAYPNAVADRINPKLLQFFRDNPGKFRWGIVAMDFQGFVLVEKIIMSNF